MKILLLLNDAPYGVERTYSSAHVRNPANTS